MMYGRCHTNFFTSSFRAGFYLSFFPTDFSELIASPKIVVDLNLNQKDVPYYWDCQIYWFLNICKSFACPYVTGRISLFLGISSFSSEIFTNPQLLDTFNLSAVFATNGTLLDSFTQYLFPTSANSPDQTILKIE